jgi:hypothetical protein
MEYNSRVISINRTLITLQNSPENRKMCEELELSTPNWGPVPPKPRMK